jgi:putative flippase GtrA
VALSPSALIERARTPGGKKAIKYTAVSAISVVVYQVALAFLYGVLRWKAARANISANVVGGVPSYYLNRRWAWGKSGRSHLMKEIVPFWVIAFVGIGFSTWAASVADHFGEHAVDTHLMRTLIVLSAAFGSFALLWVGKFILFNKFIFVTRDPDVQAALADEIVA